MSGGGGDATSTSEASAATTPAAVATTIRETATEQLTARGDDPLGTPAEAAARELFDFSSLSGTVVEHYPVNEPFAHAVVLRDPETAELAYRVIEPTLDEFQRYVRQDLAATIRQRLLDAGYERDEAGREAFDQQVTSVLSAAGEGLAPTTLHVLRYYFRRDFLGFGPIDPMMRDPDVEDISCNGADVPVFLYHATYGNVETDLRFDEDRLESLTVKLAQRAGRHLAASTPLLTTTLPDGSRIQVTLGGDVATRGSNFTIRKFREEPFTPVELVALGTFSLSEMAYLWLAIEENNSVLYVGPTASGKTTSMNATTMFIPPDHKVVSIEETREINLPHENWIADVTRESDIGQQRPTVDTYTLLSEALHQRPDHILVGEIRTDPDVVRTFFQAVGTGHAGFTTFHAESARDTLRRLRHDPLSIPDELLTDIDVISVQRLLSIEGERQRRSVSLTELRESEESAPLLQEVFAYDPGRDAIEQVDGSRLLAEIAEDRGWSSERLRTELDRRRRLLKALLEQGITDYEPVTEWLFRFARAPERTLEAVDAPEPDAPHIDVAAEPRE